MKFQAAECDKLTHYAVEKGYKTVVPIRAPLTMELAETLGCTGVYTREGGIPETFGGQTLTNKLRDCDFSLPSGTVDDQPEGYRPEIIWKFDIDVDKNKLFVSFLVHIFDREFDLIAWHRKWGSGTFECVVIGPQGQFDFTGEQPGGTQVDMGSGKKVEGPLFEKKVCNHCVAGTKGTEDGSGHITDEGEVVACDDPPANGVKGSSEGSLASASEMKRKGRGKGKATDLPSEEEIKAGVTVQ